KKRIRKSRGKGLRTTTGCLTCRARHKKCDERRPVCGPCSIAHRDCVFAGIEPTQLRVDTCASSASPAGPESNHASISPSADAVGLSNVAPSPQTAPALPSLLSCSTDEYDDPRSANPPASHDTLDFAARSVLQRQQDHQPGPPAVSDPDSPSEPLTADLASTRWFDLLAADAAQANEGFSLAPTRHASPAPEAITVNQSATTHSSKEHDATIAERPWQLDRDITLQDHEAGLFRAFADHAALWLDLLDPECPFSTHATRLALRNLGLMKAILALTSHHSMAGNDIHDLNPNVPIQYYYEALQYIQEALQYASYTLSEELLATTIIISTYEMLDDSKSNWKRHLKGVFWVQRSQNVDGASGGLRQAVWWAWLRQDLWAAFREKRACFSFWKPVKSITALSQDELARRAIYILSQAVNYCADSVSESTTLGDRIRRGNTLLAAMDQWRSCIGPCYQPLPSARSPTQTFDGIWINPARYATATQAWYLARILVTLHLPAVSGFQGYLETQRVLSEAVDAICGIAVELHDEGSQIFAAQCLFGAGLCTQDQQRREIILSLIRSCGDRTGWPMQTIMDDLASEWVKQRE
ncbi:hypothetical protein K461DRAFT_205740, partial [Myriangium duriaei CBS 260.36]